ncbi:DUF2382 domain-containing protein [Pseudanabaena sp. FACHB-1998]|uniref:DUF2382 domain-containing protein n=1 Tax=Pseudanabaena sp. FACHB-1998 TaxID=2692858 RepID=UPI001680664C|nr:DUF2382 domain-containing protein [Pseudanabaena sp. FACHB-1998]MBD2178617.1 DUF2382 domain-containing protein [Pseudanabaena sp. FACHB-1998]
MTVCKIKDFDPNYQKHFDGIDLTGFDVYTGQEKVGSIADILVEENGSLRYLVINTGVWGLGKKVLLPIGKARFDHKSKRVYIDAFSKAQVESLPNYNENDVVDRSYEEKVRNGYRPTGMNSTASSAGAGFVAHPADEQEKDAAMYELNDSDHQNLKLYEEHLIADKQRRKTGDVIVGKRVDTEKAAVSVPLDKERVIVERNTPKDAHVAVTVNAGAFQEGEIARMEVFEESVDIRKEAFVREEVNVKKIVEKETATGEEQLRSEHVEVTGDGKAIVRDDAKTAVKARQ